MAFSSPEDLTRYLRKLDERAHGCGYVAGGKNIEVANGFTGAAQAAGIARIAHGRGGLAQRVDQTSAARSASIGQALVAVFGGADALYDCGDRLGQTL